MRRTFLLGCVVVAILLVTAANSSAQNQGAGQYDTDTLSAILSVPGVGYIDVRAEREVTPSGTESSAWLEQVNFTTHDNSYCSSANVQIDISPNRMTLSFVTNWGFNRCAAGQTVVVNCEPTENTTSVHNITSGIRRAPSGQVTTHGQTNTYSNLTCTISALESEFAPAVGNASHMESTATP